MSLSAIILAKFPANNLLSVFIRLIDLQIIPLTVLAIVWLQLIVLCCVLQVFRELGCIHFVQLKNEYG